MQKESMRNMIKLSFGEEVGNSVSHGVMAALCLLMMPFSIIYSYVTGGMLKAIGISIYMISIFLMFLGSCIYHSMEFGSSQKYVMRKLDHCFIYVAIAGTYTPILLTTVDGIKAYVILGIEWIAVISGILLTSISKNHHKVLSMLLYMIMGWLAVIIIPTLLKNASIPFFVMILLGGLFYTAGVFFYAKRFPYAHFIWHIFIVLASISHYIAVVFLM